MCEVIRFVPKSERERARLIREARAIYDSIFPRADPVSGQRADQNLPAAQQMIDILSLLEVKTRGNLTAEERQLLDQILYELRLRFVEASKPQSRIITP